MPADGWKEVIRDVENMLLFSNLVTFFQVLMPITGYWKVAVNALFLLAQ